MNEQTFSGKWKEIKGELKNKWGKLTDDELESAKGNVEAIAGIVQQRYGAAKDAISKDIHNILGRFQSKNQEAVEGAKHDVAQTTEAAKNSLRDSQH